MSEQKKPRKRSRPKRTYVHRPNAVCITIYSTDGSAVPKSVLAEATEAVTDIALNNGLLIGLAET